MWCNKLKYKEITCFIFIALFFAIPLFAQIEDSSVTNWLDETDTLLVGVDNNLSPFSFVDKDRKPTGFLVDIADEIGKRLGKTVRIIPIDLGNSDISSIENRCDILMGVFKNKRFEGRFDYSNTILECQFSFYCLGSISEIDDLGELCEMSIGIHNYSPVRELIKSSCDAPNIFTLSPYNSIESVYEKELDIAVLPTMVGDYILADLALQDEIEKNRNLLLKYDYVLAVPVAKASILREIDDIISSIKRDGHLASIRREWSMVSSKEEEGENIGGIVYLVIVLIVLIGMLLSYISARISNFNISIEAEKKRAEVLETELQDLGKEFMGFNRAATSGNIGFFALRDEEGIMGRIVYINEGLENITGYSFEQLNNMSFVELFEGEDLEKVVERYKLRREGENLPECYEVKGIRSDGERRPIELSVRVVEQSDGDLTLGIIKDLSRIKTLQNKLRNSDHNFRSMLSSMPNGAIVLNNQRILFINNAFRKLVGRSPEWIRSGGISRILPPVHRSRIEALIKNLIEGKEAPKEIQFEIIGPEDNMIMLNARPRAVSYFGEKAALFIIDDKEPGEKAAKTGQTKPSVGYTQATEDLILDYNNSIMGIVGAVNQLEAMIKDDREEQEFTNIIGKEAERLSELTNKLLSITKETHEKTGRILSLHSVIRDALELLPRPPAGNLSIKTFFDARPDSIRGNLSQIHQIVLNLMVNAVESMPEGGELSIITGNTTYESSNFVNDESIRPGRYVWISVRDTGRGFSKQELETIFRPFSSTERVGAGMGLGLSLVQKLVKKHDGFIQVESEEGAGSNFTAYFPEELPLEERVKTQTDLPGGDETILVVDDEPHVRTVLKSMLGYLGYSVLLASNGAEATEIMRTRSADIDLVLLDIIMPEMGGEEAYRNIKNIKPEIKTVISTGYARDQALSDLLQKGANALIRKPYSVGTISRVIRETLDREV